MTQIEEFNKWLANPEGRHLEFKAARNSFSHDKYLPDYCAALANEGGGKLVLGVQGKGARHFLKMENNIYKSLKSGVKIL